MKTSTDPRHRRRENQIKKLYSYSFPLHASNPAIKKVVSRLASIDELISSCAPEWPVNQINKIDLAILRLAVYELLYLPSIPAKVTIDEAVELAKTYGSENAPGFVNGVLGAVLKTKLKIKNAK